MRYLLIILLITSCSAEWHLNKALKKNPQIVQAEVEYITDTVKTVLNGDTIETIREIPVPVEVVKWKTKSDIKSDKKISKEKSKQEKLVTKMMEAKFKTYKDSTEAASKLREAEIKLLKQELKTEKQETKKLKKENRSGFWDDLKYLGMWLLAIMVAVVVVRFLVLPLLKK